MLQHTKKISISENRWVSYLHAANSSTIASNGSDVKVLLLCNRESGWRFETSERCNHASLCNIAACGNSCWRNDRGSHIASSLFFWFNMNLLMSTILLYNEMIRFLICYVVLDNIIQLLNIYIWKVGIFFKSPQ